MGYRANGNGTLKLKHLPESQVRELLDSLNLQHCKTLYEGLVGVFNADVDQDEVTDEYETYSLYFDNNYWDDDVTAFLRVFEPYTLEGELEYIGEDYDMWRFQYRNNAWYFDLGTVEYIENPNSMFATKP